MTRASEFYTEQFGAVRDGLPGAGLPWLAELRRAGLDRFAEAGWPTPRVEDWKYTNLKDLAALDTVPATANGTLAETPASLLPASLQPAGRPAHRLVFVDGAYRDDLSHLGALSEGVTLGSLAAALADDPASLEPHLGRVGSIEGRPLLALNTAFMGDGLLLRLADGAVLDAPVEVVFVATAGDATAALHPRLLIVAGRDSRATIVEHHLSAGGREYFSNTVAEIALAEGATLRHYKLQDEATDAWHIAATEVTVGAGAAYESFYLSLGGRLARNEIRVRLEGEGGRCLLGGAYLADGRQHTDATTVIEHLAPETKSREVYKGVVDGRARAVFQGRITVHEGAQRIEGHQLNRTLLLSDRAEIDIKPELEIFADDVKCSHGATAGEIDDDALFYLRSRGIPEDEARGILVSAFLDDVLDEITDEAVREALRIRVADRLNKQPDSGETA